MKKSHYIAVAAAALLISSTAWAGALTVPNTFSAGTPAVAADVNANFTAAKTAVDDNNTRITANAVSAATNTTNITANAASAATNTTNITANAASAATNATNITANAASAATNTTDIAANVTNITALQNAKPGFATAVNNSGTPTTIIGMTATGQAIVTLTINAPAAGFAIVTGKAFSVINHTVGTLHLVGMKISATSGDVVAEYDLSASQIADQQPTALYGKMLSASAVIPVVAGANIIYLNAYAPIGTGHNIQQPKLTAIYVPNAY